MLTIIKNENFDNYINKYNFNEYKEQLKLYSDNNITILPRLFIKNYPDNNLVRIDKDIKIETADINFTKSLRDNQLECSNFLLNEYNKKNNIYGILKLYPGAGKTVLATWLSSIIKLKTCIVVDSEMLMKQWIDRIINFTDTNADEIGLIHRNLFTVNNKKFVITTVQTLLSKFKYDFWKSFEKINDAGFGLVYYDEVHASSSSEKYSKTSLLFSTKNIIGLSATPFHHGLSELLMKNTIGDIIYELDKYESIPEYYFIYYNSNIKNLEVVVGDQTKNKKPQKLYNIINRISDPIKKKAIYNKYILNSQTYNDIITKYVYNLTLEGHVTIIMCARRDQVDQIYDNLTNLNCPIRKVYSNNNYFDPINDINIVTTAGSFQKGIDMDRLSCIIIVSPYSGQKSIFQMIGRILRQKSNKKSPIVFDLIDKDYPSIFIDDVKRKMKILPDEYKNIKIKEHDEK